MSNKKRTSPTINKNVYETITNDMKTPISTYIERKFAQDVLGEEIAKNILIDIEVIKMELDFYTQVQSMLQKRIAKREHNLKELEEKLENDCKQKIADNLQLAQERLMKLVTEERIRRESKEANNVRYTPKSIPIADVELICEQYDVTPKMVLPLMNRNVLREFFEKYEKYL